MSARYPFSAIAGQDEMKLALLLTAVDPLIGGLLAFGDRGTGKSTAVRALAALLPKMRATAGCAYHCDPDSSATLCATCRAAKTTKVRQIAIPVVDLPLGATKDRVIGALNLERALSYGEKTFEAGLLAKANRGYLYVDEVNLLEDHIVDLLLDVAASGENVVEREGLSIRHPARFGLSVEVRTPSDVATWVEIVKRREAFERNPQGFSELWASKEQATRRRLVNARKRLGDVVTPDQILERAAALCIHLKTDCLRGQLTLMRAASALAADTLLATCLPQPGGLAGRWWHATRLGNRLRHPRGRTSTAWRRHTTPGVPDRWSRQHRARLHC